MWGGVPSPLRAWPPPDGGRTLPLLLYVEGGREKAPETAGKEGWTHWGELGGPCPAGRVGREEGRLKTTRIDSRMVNKLNRTEKILKTRAE